MFRKATVAGSKALLCLYSESGGGKTYSGLLLARGLAGPNGSIAMIDTENRRGEIYADDPLIGGYDVAQLEPPFSPDRYIEAIDAAERAGYDAIMIDSGSHEWEGEGGVLDMAADIAERRFNRSQYNQGKEWDGVVSFGDWKEPKIAHKHLIQRLQRCKAHVIICLRAQYKSRQIDKKDYSKHGITSNAKTTVVRDEYQSPIQDEKFIYEVTVHAQMSNANPGVPMITKCPDMLLHAFPAGQRITVETGARVKAFYDKGAPASDDMANVIRDARLAAEGGTDRYQAFFSALTKEQRRDLAKTGEHDRLKSVAADRDAPASDPAPDFEDQPGFDDDMTADRGGIKMPGDAGFVKPNFD